MRTLKLQRKRLGFFLERIRSRYELWGPVQKGENYVYDPIDNLEGLMMDPVKTFLPVKKLFLPPRTELLRFRDHRVESLVDDTPRAVFGVPPCEIHSLLILDRIFTAHDPDPYYMARRENTLLIVQSCEPDMTCFCHATGTDIVQEGFDIGLTKLDEFYIVWVLTSKGDDLTRISIDLFDDLTREDVEMYTEWRKQRDTMFNIDFDFRAIPDIMDLHYDSPIWDEFGEKCLSCGACSMVCPTCNCFNVVDHVKLSDDVIRERHWDSCMFKEYSMVAGGHNFREARKERLKLWYTHKLRSFGELKLPGMIGRPSCVGCGRCLSTCPVEINVATVVEAITTGEVKSSWVECSFVRTNE